MICAEAVNMQSISWSEITVIIGIISGLTAIIVSISSMLSKREQKVSAMSEIRTELRTISGNVNDIKTDMKELKTTVSYHAERLALVEASTKSAHKRIDRLEKLPENKEDLII